MHTQEQETERKYKLISGSSTAIFFILLSLLLWYIKFSKPEKDEIPEELSVAVEFPQDPTGGGGGGGSEGGPSDDVPVDVNSPDVPNFQMPSATEQTSDATAVPDSKSNPNPTKTPEISEEERLLNEMIGSKKNQTKPSGGGTGPDFGDGGSGSGSGGGDGSGKGTGKGPGLGPGSGLGFGLEGFGSRGLNGYRKAPDNCNRPGTIKLSITVKADGSIIDMDPVPGYDIDNCLIERAKACLKNAKFDQTTNNKLVTGVITIKFTQQ